MANTAETLSRDWIVVDSQAHEKFQALDPNRQKLLSYLEILETFSTLEIREVLSWMGKPKGEDPTYNDAHRMFTLLNRAGLIGEAQYYEHQGTGYIVNPAVRNQLPRFGRSELHSFYQFAVCMYGKLIEQNPTFATSGYFVKKQRFEAYLFKPL